MTLCNIVDISQGFDFPEPKGAAEELYTFYDMLWVGWEDGVAYRRGAGLVRKDAWEESEKEDIYLVLG